MVDYFVKMIVQPNRMNLETLLLVIPALGVLALLFTWWKTQEINATPEGSERMSKIAASIQEGAMAFLKAEYRILVVFVAGVAALLYWSGSNNENSHALVAVSFAVGALCSALAGYLGMKVATKANVRTANAAKDSLGKALEVAFSGGAVMGLGVVGLGILGLGGPLLSFRKPFWSLRTASFSWRHPFRVNRIFFWCFIHCSFC